MEISWKFSLNTSAVYQIMLTSEREFFGDGLGKGEGMRGFKKFIAIRNIYPLFCFGYIFIDIQSMGNIYK